MAKNSTNIINLNLDKETIDLFKHGTIGFEKESLRVSNLQISNMPHPISIGSALCNSYITTDFAEALFAASKISKSSHILVVGGLVD